MDASELLKGIKEFYINILPKASSSSGWSENDITNAFHWADFCEKVGKLHHSFKMLLGSKSLDTVDISNLDWRKGMFYHGTEAHMT